MGILKLKSEKKKREKIKETKINYERSFKKTKIKDTISSKKDEGNEFDISVFMKTNHSSNKIRQINYGKLVKSIKSNNNIIFNNIEKILEIFANGIIDEDDCIRNYSAKIFYYILNSYINCDVYFNKIKTSIFYSLKGKIEKLKIYNLELCYNLFFKKIEYSHNFFYDFLNAILDCFISLPIDKKVKNVKYIFLLFEQKAQHKRCVKLGKDMKKIRNEENNMLRTERMCDKFEKNDINYYFWKNIYLEDDQNYRKEDEYESIIRQNIINNNCDNFLIKKDIKTSINIDTKINIYIKMFKCLYNFLDEIECNNMNIEIISLYTKISKCIIYFIKKKKSIIKIDIILLINKFIKKFVEIINNKLNILNDIFNISILLVFRFLDMIYYFVIMIIFLCVKDINLFEIVKKKIYIDFIYLIKYCVTIYVYVLIVFDFFKISNNITDYSEELNKHADRNVVGIDDEVNILCRNEICKYEKECENKSMFDSFEINKENCNEVGNNMKKWNKKEFVVKYFKILIYFYNIYINIKEGKQKIFINFIITLGGKNLIKIENTEKKKFINIIMDLIKKKIEIYNYDNEEKLIWELLLNYINNFSEKSIEKIIYLCYYIVILSQTQKKQNKKNNEIVLKHLLEERAINKREDSDKTMISEKCTKGNIKSNDKENKNDIIALSFFTAPFMFIFLADCSCFINNKFFEFFYKCMKINDKEKVIKILLFLQKEENINIITKNVFNSFMNNLIYFLNNCNNSIFINNFIGFISIIQNNIKCENGNSKLAKANKGLKEKGDNFEQIDKLILLDIRQNLKEILEEKKEILISYFLNRNNSNLLSLKIIRIFYHIYGDKNCKLLNFIYCIIIKYINGKYGDNFILAKKEVKMLLHGLFYGREINVHTHFNKNSDQNNDKNICSSIYNNACFYMLKEDIKSGVYILDKYLYKDNFLIFFLNLKIYKTWKIFKNDVYSFIDENNNYKNINIEDNLKDIEYTNLILILKKISYITSHINVYRLSNSDKCINNKNIIVSYIFKLIKINIYDKLFDNGYSNDIYIPYDRIFINIKIIFFFNYLSYYLFHSLSLQKCEDAVISIKNFKDEIEKSEQVIELNNSLNDDIAKEITEKMDKNVDPYYCVNNECIEKIMPSNLLFFLKSFFNNPNRKNVNEINSENIFNDIIMHIIFSKDLFNLIYDKRNYFYYLSNINVNLDHSSEFIDNDYSFKTHKIIQELLNNFERNIDIINFKELTTLRVRKILILFSLFIFRISYNGNILKRSFLKYENGDIKKYLNFFNFFILFNYFVSYLSEEILVVADKQFSCSAYYTISFLLDIILCFYGIIENIEKMEEFPDYRELKKKENNKKEFGEKKISEINNEILMEIRNELKILNKKLKHTIEELSNKGKKYFFPQTEILINKI
ncbi:conserved Plasmodium protein, unknown function [Plasmodium berghei]|uniref:Uncharacterized protein n=2 Tax=Plasmodium berghei TaxID=5821 RepID=A0A509AH05_PLABA|nr:conserved Plasmodium protein, unknown function [Plasmodium berghei ANKA]CXI20879.1 conserved Plasmodium protein, unknown function [Plasmodium berghei]SCM20007.1 conserved Plasmodium protein, unknown function [Plasmodium berghei]SCN23696.1 conserved Plasmodium protein, unknown function [Plasmodium berghei]SCO59212.1 conserved Plasmodium protein, unknown function [Plasmodium berghei]SCO60025.1 conserved Plasmodium protein, unknown function [Plasmodium berghei]|eukprot:XP_034420726.1 conserved Plasmodium protein, unknown function [Plasmodium berghei ANKA]